MSQLPFNAEYAKSGRAGCKLCKMNIKEGSLRLAKMVQSPFFDGKVPMWFHYSCFFKKNKITQLTDLFGFDSLRWEDQQKVKNAIQGDAPGLDTAETSRVFVFLVDLARTARSRCKKCNTNIQKSDFRIGVAAEQDPPSSFAPTPDDYYHAECFRQNRAELGAVHVTADKLIGFSDLSKEQQQNLVKAVGKSTAAEKRKAAQIGKAAKKPKVNDEEKDIMTQQNQLWKLKEEIKSGLHSAYLWSVISKNQHPDVSSELEKISVLADLMMFGQLLPCPECSGKLKLRNDSYACTGNISEWTKCQYTTQHPKREPFLVPDDVKDHEFFKGRKFSVKERLFTKKDDVKAVLKPFHRKVVASFGDLTVSQAELKKKIVSLGGEYGSVTRKTLLVVISTTENLADSDYSKTVQKIQKNMVPVVTVEFLDAVSSGDDPTELIDKYCISSWTQKDRQAATKKKKYGAEEGKDTSVQKFSAKGGAVVDPDAGLNGDYHVHSLKGLLFSAVLGKVDLVTNTNSYYKLQLLCHDAKPKNYVFRSWGRVGTGIGNKLLEGPFSLDQAISLFTGHFEDKTGNIWGNPNAFTKKPGRFFPLEVDFSEGAKENIEPSEVAPSVLEPEVQYLMKLICDIKTMTQTMVEFEIDIKKMPLGKLSAKQISKAYSVLSELENLILNKASKSKLLDATNRFFTLIPHDFGMDSPPLLTTMDMIQLKTKMLDSLRDMEIASTIIQDNQTRNNPIDSHYHHLNCNIKVVPKDCRDYEFISTYLRNTVGSTHGSFSLEIEQVFSVKRNGEEERFSQFSKLHNRKLLWHGSRLSNFLGILSQGLRIAPPEAPSTGYMFGKGVYFADMVSKSANYCLARKNETGLLLLCEVALGDMYEKENAEFIRKLPKGKHSTKGIGYWMPNPEQDLVLEDGVVVPLGISKQNAIKHSLNYNEYIVYDVDQVKIRYLVCVKFLHRI